MTGDRRRLATFAAVGLASTALYAMLARLGMAAGLAAPLASLLAYALSGVFSYLGHRRITFRSQGESRDEAQRFVIVNAFGYGLAALLPFLIVDVARLPETLAILAVCFAAPAVNYVLLHHFVFRPPVAAGRA